MNKDADKPDTVTETGEERFRRYYEKELLPRLLDLRKLQRRAFYKSLAFSALFAAPGLLILLLALSSGAVAEAAKPVVTFLLLSLFVYGFLSPHLGKSVQSAFKETILLPIAQYVIPGIQYDREGIVQPKHFDQSLLFGAWGSYRGGDHFYGRTDAAKYEFCRLAVQTSQKSTATVFNGVFLTASLPQEIHGAIFVVPLDFGEKKNWLRRLYSEVSYTQPGRLMDPEFPEFAEHFAVYATEPREAERVLTPAILRRILDIRADSPALFRVSLVGNRLYAGFHSDTARFWLPRRGGELDFTHYDGLRRDFLICRDMARLFRE